MNGSGSLGSLNVDPAHNSSSLIQLMGSEWAPSTPLVAEGLLGAGNNEAPSEALRPPSPRPLPVRSDVGCLDSRNWVEVGSVFSHFRRSFKHRKRKMKKVFFLFSFLFYVTISSLPEYYS